MTFRRRAETLKGWARLRELAIRQRLAEGGTGMMLLLWCYFRHPDARLRVAAKLQATLDAEGRATLVVARNRSTGTTAAVVMPRFDLRAADLAALQLPDGFSYAAGLEEEPAGSA